MNLTGVAFVQPIEAEAGLIGDGAKVGPQFDAAGLSDVTVAAALLPADYACTLSQTSLFGIA